MKERADASLTVVFEGYLYESPDGQFCVANVIPEGGTVSMRAIGPIRGCVVGETLRLHGRYTEHRTYGRRFRVERLTPVMPTTSAGIAKFLGSGLVDGVGPALAQRLVDKFGERTLDIIVREPKRVREVEGIGPKRASSIADSLREKRVQAESLSFLHALGLGAALSRRVFERYGEKTVHQIRENPYLVAEQVAGVGFSTADKIGAAVGFSESDPRRLEGAVLHLLGVALDQGHSHHTGDSLRQALGEAGVPDNELGAGLKALEQRELIVVEGQRVYPAPTHAAEVFVSEELRRLAMAVGEPRAFQVSEASLSVEQISAVSASLASGLLVVTGGPGTGKTTVTRSIVEAHRTHGENVLLGAPTGRAAKRLQEATGCEAKTLHRLLEWSPRTGGFGRNSEFPLDADVVLVDEASMIDLRLMADLLAAISGKTRLVLVGDADQLPPVGAGRPFLNLLRSGVCSVSRLTAVFRQAQASAIVGGAHAILNGESPRWTPPGQKGSGDLFMIATRSPDDSVERVLQCVDRLAEAYGLDATKDLMVLAPMRRGPLGVHALNERLRSRLNSAAGGSPNGFVPGDKVMQLRNDYEREVYNGDLGRVVSVAHGVTSVNFDGRIVEVAADALDQLVLAYASTVHKVQGSEFPAVVIVMYGGHHVMLSRALLYTALTRAKKLAICIGDPRAFRRAWENASVQRARSGLAQRLASQNVLAESS